MKNKKRTRQCLIIAAKIAVGSSAAILIAELLGVEHYASAGIVTLLTLMTTKWESLKLSALRLITFAISIGIAFVVFYLIDIDWISYGIYIFFTIFIAYLLGWTATISVNAVIGTHLLLDGHFTGTDVLNEFLIVIIGVCIAIVLNLFHDYHHQKKSIVANMRYVEGEMQKLMRHLAAFLLSDEEKLDTRGDFEAFRKELQGFINEAIDYQDNTFHSHPGYYIDYFIMRRSQCNIIANLQDELERIKTTPSRAKEASELMEYVADNIVEMADPIPQLERIRDLFEDMRKDEPPKDIEEFESRALLYHILSDLEEFLHFKQRFIQNLSERQISEYRS